MSLLASWAEDQERARAYDEALSDEPGFRPDPKPRGRVKADLSSWEATRRLLDGDGCQVCGRKNHPWGFSFHHIVPRSQGGDDVIENIAVLCGHGTVGCHGDVEARRNDARTRLRRNMTVEQMDYVRRKKGREYLARHYPQHVPSTNREKEASDA